MREIVIPLPFALLRLPSARDRRQHDRRRQLEDIYENANGGKRDEVIAARREEHFKEPLVLPNGSP
jgi:hypothetical protein